MAWALGVDIGGTKVAGGLVSAAGKCLHYTELPSIPGDGDEMFRQVMRTIRNVMLEAGVSSSDIRGIGVGVPGKVDREKGLAVMQNNLPWRNFPLADRIRGELSVPVVLDNDVSMAAHGEWLQQGDPRRRPSFISPSAPELPVAPSIGGASCGEPVSPGRSVWRFFRRRGSARGKSGGTGDRTSSGRRGTGGIPGGDAPIPGGGVPGCSRGWKR